VGGSVGGPDKIELSVSPDVRKIQDLNPPPSRWPVYLAIIAIILLAAFFIWFYAGQQTPTTGTSTTLPEYVIVTSSTQPSNITPGTTRPAIPHQLMSRDDVINFCSKEDEVFRDECYRTGADYTKDPMLCYRIVDYPKRADCYVSISCGPMNTTCRQTFGKNRPSPPVIARSEPVILKESKPPVTRPPWGIQKYVKNTLSVDYAYYSNSSLYFVFCVDENMELNDLTIELGGDDFPMNNKFSVNGWDSSKNEPTQLECYEFFVDNVSRNQQYSANMHSKEVNATLNFVLK